MGRSLSHFGRRAVDHQTRSGMDLVADRRTRGADSDAPATYVRALDLSVERLEQTYLRLDDDGAQQRYQYRAPLFDFDALIVYDASGLVVDYPGIASRVL
jgi:hypothetical protein